MRTVAVFTLLVRCVGLGEWDEGGRNYGKVGMKGGRGEV